MIGFLHNWSGYLLVRVQGFTPERFLNLCGANGIEIWNLQYRDGFCECCMTVKGFYQCKLLARKAKVRLKILKKLGLPFFLHKNRKRTLFLTGFLSFFLLLYLMSMFVWDISFEGNHQYTDDTLIQYLERQDIRYGMWKQGISCEEIEAGIRNQFSEITWVSARVSGTRLLVKVKENEVLSSIPIKEEFPCDIVASTEGVITRMVIRQGIANAAIGDQVEAGTLLVSSGVPITNDSEELVRTEYVHADADIYARTSHEFNRKFPSLHTVKVKTGKKKQGYFFKIFGYRSVLLLPERGEEQWDYVLEEKQIKIFEDFYLPFYYGTIKGEAYVSYERFYTQEELNQIAERLQIQFLEKLIEKGVHIIENNVKILGNESVCQIRGYASGEELIGQQVPVTELKAEESTETR